MSVKSQQDIDLMRYSGLDPLYIAGETTSMLRGINKPLLLLIGLFSSCVLAETEPLHQKIDRLVLASLGDAQVAEATDDANFLRRVTLDFAGRIPTVDEVESFMASTNLHKRTEVIERLMAGPEYPKQMANRFHIMLMERRGDQDEWLAWLEKAFAENRPWNEIVRQMVRADYRDEAHRPASYFYTKRLEKYGENPTDYPGLTRDVGRLFLGMDLQCAQCHKHLEIDTYDQVDFQGLFAAYQHLKLTNYEGKPVVEEPVFLEKLSFASVFNQRNKTTGPRVPGLPEIEPVIFTTEESWAVEPDRKTKVLGIPRFSPLEAFAETMSESPTFIPNIVNRLWFALMGHGLVEPLDLHHVDNPATHPEVLEVMCAAFREHGMDIKWLMRELALTDTYQRRSAFSDGDSNSPAHYALAAQRRLSAEQLQRALFLATGNTGDAQDEDEAKEWKKQFLGAFANPPKEPELEFAPSVESALFMSNDAALQKLLEPAGDNLMARMATAKDAEIANAVYVQIYSRPPTSEEREWLNAHLTAGKSDRNAAVREWVWAMLSSTEFVVNH